MIVNIKKDMTDHFEVKVHFQDVESSSLVTEALLRLLPSEYNRNVVVVCIGTDRSTGDSLGPLIGSFLMEAGLKNFHIYGTLDEPVHAVNLEAKLQEIHARHHDPFMIGIDACLGRLKSVGDIKVGAGPVKPGAGVKKVLPEVGDIHITGIVNISGYMEFFVLQNTRLNLVMSMAKRIAEGIIEADRTFTIRRRFLQLEFEIEQENSVK